MKRILGLIAIVALAVGAFAASPVARAQRGGDTISCGSENGRRAFCRVPWRDARLVRQDSKTACIRGRTWDVDRGGLWVDNGCRGTFQEAGGWGGGRPGDDGRPGFGGGGRPGWGGGSQVISCGSINNRRNFCRAEVGRGARMVAQDSDSACREGSTFGFTRDGVWVDRGCRGRFDLGR